MPCSVCILYVGLPTAYVSFAVQLYAMCALSCIGILTMQQGIMGCLVLNIYGADMCVQCVMQHATSDSLVVLDELGRGTSTFDGYAIAHAVLKHVSSKVDCRLLFATHYHPLTTEFANNPRIRLGHMSVLLGDPGMHAHICMYTLAERWLMQNLFQNPSCICWQTDQEKHGFFLRLPRCKLLPIAVSILVYSACSTRAWSAFAVFQAVLAGHC